MRPELSDELLDEADALNRLRNQLAHNLDEKKYQERRAAFLAYTREKPDPVLLAEFSEVWIAIMSLHSRLTFAVEFDPATLRLPTLLTMEPASQLSASDKPNSNPSAT